MEELLKKAAIIRDETEDNQNSAWRVGTMFVDFLQEMQKYLPPLSAFGSSIEKSITQSFFTEQVQGHTIGKVDFNNLDTLNNINSLGSYHVFREKTPIGEMIVTGDNMRHTIIQFMFGNYTVDDGTLNAHVDSIATIAYRIYNLNAPNLPNIPRNTWSNWKYIQEGFFKSEFGTSKTDSVTQSFFTEQVQGHTVGQVDVNNLDTLNSINSLGSYHVFKEKIPIGEMIVTGDNMRHTIIQFMFSNYTVDDGTLNAHVDSIATIVYRIYNLNAPNLPDISRGTWGQWKLYGQNYEILNESEYENLKAKNTELFYYTYEEEEEV